MGSGLREWLGRWRVVPIAFLLVGCPVETDFVCERSEECVDAGVQGVCQPNNYCSFPDEDCGSGQRYAEHAPSGFAQECVPPDVPQGSSGGMQSDGNGDATSSSPPEVTGSSSGVDSGEPLPDSACVEVDLGQALGPVDMRTLARQDDDFTSSCGDDDAPDVVYAWTAAVTGTYRFRAVGDLDSSLSLQLRESCNGDELRCSAELFDAFSETTFYDFEQGESVLVIVDSSPGDDGAFSLEIVLVPE